jgi:hypothetical protein
MKSVNPSLSQHGHLSPLEMMDDKKFIKRAGPRFFDNGFHVKITM